MSATTRRNQARILKVANREFARGNHAAAIARCQQIVEADPKHLGALELLSRSLWATQDFAALELTTRKLIALNPYEPGYFGLRGMALRALGRYGEAAHALRRDPGSANQLADLEAFQSSLVKDLIEQDAVFAAEYAKNPARAGSKRGFEYVTPLSEPRTATATRRKSPSIRQYN